MAKKFKVDGYTGVYYRLVNSKVHRGREEKCYYYVFKQNGKRIEERAGREREDEMTPAKAERLRKSRIEGLIPSPKEQRQKERIAKDQGKKKKWTIDRLWNEYSTQRLTNANTLANDKNRYETHLKKPFGDTEPHKLDQIYIERFRNTLLKERSSQTVKHILALLKRIINFGVDTGVSKPQNFKIRVPDVYNEKTEFLTNQQISSLIDACEKNSNKLAADIIMFALSTGMKRGEIINLKWTDIDFERGFLFIRDPKGKKTQNIPLNEVALQLTDSQERKSDFVFSDSEGKRLVSTTLTRWARAICDKAGIPRSFRPLHGLRHTFASNLASSGQVDMYTLQKLLTHKKPEMTQRYAHLREEVLKAGSDVAAFLINNVKDKKSDDPIDKQQKLFNDINRYDLSKKKIKKNVTRKSKRKEKNAITKMKQLKMF